MEATKTEHRKDVNAVGITELCLYGLLAISNNYGYSSSFYGDKLKYVHVNSKFYNNCPISTCTVKFEDYTRIFEAQLVIETNHGEREKQIAC
jgi:hypothetical protein